MRQAVDTLTISTPGPGLHEITGKVVAWTAAEGVSTGFLMLFCRHTSTSLLIQENAAPALRTNLERFFADLAPEDRSRYAHDDEGRTI